MSDRIKLPLLKDHHSHPLFYASMVDAIDFSGITTKEQANLAIAESVQQPLTMGFAWRDNLFQWSDEEFESLPATAIFNISLHHLMINRAGRQILQDRYGDAISKLDDRDWYESNLRVVLNWFANLNASVEKLNAFYTNLELLGVGYAEEMLLVDEQEIELFERAGLSAKTRFFSAPDTFRTLSAESREQVAGLKLFTDGAIGARTAAVGQPFANGGHGKTENCGMLIYSENELAETVDWCLQQKNELAIHAIGDRAIEQVIHVLERSNEELVTRSEIRMEHAQLMDAELAARAKSLGLVLSMQPNFNSDSIHYADRMNAEQLRSNNNFRMLIDQIGFQPGEDLIFGSDGMPHGVQYALQQSLFPPFESQQLTLEEFVAGYCAPDAAPAVQLDIDYDVRTVVLSDEASGN